jgi:hypothetical protein
LVSSYSFKLGTYVDIFGEGASLEAIVEPKSILHLSSELQDHSRDCIIITPGKLVNESKVMSKSTGKIYQSDSLDFVEP